MKTILKVILALSLVSSVLFGADEYSEQKEQIVSKIVEHFGVVDEISGRIPDASDCETKKNDCYLNKYGDEIKEYFTKDFLNTFKNNKNICPGNGDCLFYFSKDVKDYIFKCQKGVCKIDDIKIDDRYEKWGDRVKKAVVNANKTIRKAEKVEQEFKTKLLNYYKQYKISKKFYNSFKKKNATLGLYFSQELKDCKTAKKYAKIKAGADYSLELNQNEQISLNSEYIDGNDLHLIFNCNDDKCEIIDVGVYGKSDVWGYEPDTLWLKEKCAKK